MQTRRAFLAGTGALAVMARSAAAADAEPGLGAIAASRGVLYGAAVGAAQLLDEDFAAQYRRECAALVGENDFKWATSEPAADRPDFRRADAVASFARAHGMALRGHTMIWHEALPAWARERVEAGPAQAEAAIRARVLGIGARYRGAVTSWDVVNEAIDGADRRPDRMRVSPFFKVLGERFLDVAFAAAREADPGAHLAYNDFGVEHAVPWQDGHRVGVLRLLERLRGRGVPVDTLGIQAHLRAEFPFDEAVFARFLNEVAGLGLRIEITELDVDDRGLPAAPGPRDTAVAAMARRFLDVALAHKQVRTVMTWGLSDRRSWLSDMPARRRADGERQRGLPLDEAFVRKPMWHAMAAAFRAAPKRD
jgi:endo-1,4-beta-xylanase